MLHIRDSEMMSGSHPPVPGMMWLGCLVQFLPFSSPSSRYKTKEVGNSGLIHFPLLLDPFHFNQWSTLLNYVIIIKNKIKKEKEKKKVTQGDTPLLRAFSLKWISQISQFHK